MCDIKAVDTEIKDNMNVQPNTLNEQTMSIEVSTTAVKQEATYETFVEDVIDSNDTSKVKDETKHSTNAPKGKGDDVSDASSSGEEDDDNEDEDDNEDDNDDSEQQVNNGSDQGIIKNADGTLQIPQRYTKSGRKRSVPFPVRLMTVLSDPKFHHIIEWLPSGKSFVIHKPKVFATEILPHRFKSAKYSSFTRKLHRWGFVRHFRGGESGAFFHVEFQKGRLDLAEAMTCCQQQKEAASKKARKAKLQSSKTQATKNTKSLSPSTRKAGSASFRNVVTGSASQQRSPEAQSRGEGVTRTPSMRLPHAFTNPSTVPSEFSPLLNSFSGLPMPKVSTNMGGGGGADNFMQQYAALSVDQQHKLLSQQLDPSSTATMSDLQKQIMKARLDAAIKEELNRIEYARLAKERLETANAVHRYNAILQQQQRQQQQRQNLLGLQTCGTLGNVPSSLFGGVQSPPSTSSSLLGVGGGVGRNMLSPVLSQLSRAELEQYALAMSTAQARQSRSNMNSILLDGAVDGIMQQQQQQQQQTQQQLRASNLPYNMNSSIRDARSNAF